MMYRAGLALVFAVAVTGCELSEVAVPQGEPIVVVHGVMRPDLSQQFIVIERTFSGALDVEDLGRSIPSGGSPLSPIEGAVVHVTNLDFPGDPCGTPVMFTTVPQDRRLPILPGVYWAPPSCPGMRPGDRLALRVETPEGEVVTGQTRIAALESASVTVAGSTVAFGTLDTTTFNRDQDTLQIEMVTSAGRLMQLEVRRIGDFSAFALNKILIDTTAITLPGDLPNVFEGGEGEDIFRGGRHYTMTVAVTDSNYYDFARSQNSEFTGRGFINHLTGGMGVFGSLAALSTTATAVSDVDDQREGVFRLQGQIQGIDVDAQLTVYLARSVDSTRLSAFLDGAWFQWVDPDEGQPVWQPWQVERHSVDGEFRADSLAIVVIQSAAPQYFPPDAMQDEAFLTGLTVVGAPFSVEVTRPGALGRIPVGTLTATQQ